MTIRQNLIAFLAFFFIAATADSQHFLLVENRHNLHNFKYFEGDGIRMKAKPDGRIVEGIITVLTDSSVFVGAVEEVYMTEIITIYRQRTGIRWLQGALLLGGIAYFSIDSFNRLINNQAPVILTETAVISAGMISAGFLLQPAQYKKLHTERWDLRMIDFSTLDDAP